MCCLFLLPLPLLLCPGVCLSTCCFPPTLGFPGVPPACAFSSLTGMCSTAKLCPGLSARLGSYAFTGLHKLRWALLKPVGGRETAACEGEEILPFPLLRGGLSLYYPPRSAKEHLASKKLGCAWSDLHVVLPWAAPRWCRQPVPAAVPEARGRGSQRPSRPARTASLPQQWGKWHQKTKGNNKRPDLRGDISSSLFVYLIEKLIGSF